MNKKRSFVFAASVLVFLGGMAYLGGVHDFVFGRLPGLLGPAGAEAGKPQDASAPAEASPRTGAKAKQIKIGMTRGQVEAIMGLPAMAWSERANGRDIRTAAWMAGEKLLAVGFLDGTVATVTLKPMRQLTAAEGSSTNDRSRPDLGSQTPSPSADDPPRNLQDALRDLADKLKGREDVVGKLLDEAKSQ